MKIYYLFDPLCGWCYGASPAVNALAEHYPIQLTPTGLFCRSGRQMDVDFAEYAWRNDQRIAQLTGQVFSAAYRENVLRSGGDFDSANILLALTAVQTVAPEQELPILTALQTARYVDGRDNADWRVITDVLRSRGLADAVSLAMTADNEHAMLARIAFGQQLAQRLGVSGVPQLAVERQEQWSVLPSRLLQGDVRELLAHVQSFA